MGNLPDGVAPNHSPYFAPVPEPTLDLGVALLVAAARDWLRAAEGGPTGG